MQHHKQTLFISGLTIRGTMKGLQVIRDEIRKMTIYCVCVCLKTLLETVVRLS